MANRQARRALEREERKRAGRAQHESRQPAPTQSQSRGLLAVRQLDGFHPLRDALSQIATKTAEWAGIPMPLEGERLVIEPSYPWAEQLSGIGAKPVEDDGWRERNSWYSLQRRGTVLIAEKEGKIDWGVIPGFHGMAHALSTLGCSEAWGIEQEGRAVQLLGGMLRHRTFKQYLLTGMFLERSKRSGVTYLFRKLRPTVAIAANGSGKGAAWWRRRQLGDSMKILAALCMHPIAYYEGSWAGAMCPTDDVIAHLSLMRGERRCSGGAAISTRPIFPRRAFHDGPA